MAHFALKNLTFSYPGRAGKTLDGITLEIQKGEYVALCGASGSGKTTLLRHLKTVLTPFGSRSGDILLDGKSLQQIPLGEQAARIGFVMQDPDDQIVTDKVWHELAFGLESLGVAQSTMRLRVAEMACYFGIQDWFHRDVAELSGGQKQLLNLASIMAMQPEVLILDEPTSQLDPIAASDFLNTVRKINLELGTTVIITEHRLEDIYPHADRVVVMEGGRIAADSDPRQVGAMLWQGQSSMFAALPTPVRVFYSAGGEGACPLTVREGRYWLENALRGRKLLPPEEEEPVFRGETPPVLELKQCWFRYDRQGKDILKGTEFSLFAGEIFAVVGGNGAGKSTMLKAICGICKPYRGKIRLFGKKLQDYKPEWLYNNCLAMLPQDPKSLFGKKTMASELAEMSADPKKQAEVAELCGIAHLLQSHPHDLSGGEQQRAALAKVLLTDPKLLLLDEPTKGLDSFFKQQFGGILKKLAAKGTTVLMVSHDVEFCAEFASRVGMFFDGQMLTCDTPEGFFGQNSFYTTAANRMSRGVFPDAVTAEAVARRYRRNREAEV